MGDTPDARVATGGGGVANAVESMDTGCDEEAYRMNRPKRGVFLIINNRDFDKKTLQKRRDGTDEDAKNLHQLFKGRGFDVRLEHNKTCTEMLRILDGVAKEDHTNNDCFMCAILSHGDFGVVYGTDDIIQLDILVNPFKGRQCATLTGKPKVFIIQACRGHQYDDGIEVADAIGETEQKIYRIPEEADFLYAYSTAPGYFSWRNSGNGSWFIQALCKVFQKDCGERDILTLLTKVNRMVAYEFQSNASRQDMNRKKQIPSIVSMLTKQLYLRRK
ncbi:Caspase-3 [Lamellibrachia satsuma]|nr:Caspase-3 [Lamellibrachia satsuma]